MSAEIKATHRTISLNHWCSIKRCWVSPHVHTQYFKQKCLKNEKTNCERKKTVNLSPVEGKKTELTNLNINPLSHVVVKHGADYYDVNLSAERRTRQRNSEGQVRRCSL